MPVKAKQKFNVGDEVASTYDGISFPPLGNGVVVGLEPADFKGKNNVLYEIWRYYVYWYSHGNILLHWDDEISRCKGIIYRDFVRDNKGNYKTIRRKMRCSKCEYYSICQYLREIVCCDVSEFAHWRSGNKRSLELCEQRKCPHRFICGGKRFIQTKDVLNGR
jgi:hypothetical protein